MRATPNKPWAASATLESTGELPSASRLGLEAARITHEQPNDIRPRTGRHTHAHTHTATVETNPCQSVRTAHRLGPKVPMHGEQKETSDEFCRHRQNNINGTPDTIRLKKKKNNTARDEPKQPPERPARN